MTTKRVRSGENKARATERAGKRRPRSTPDLELIGRLRAVVIAAPSLPKGARRPADDLPSDRNAAARALIAPDRERLAVLREQHAPDACLPSICETGRTRTNLTDPVWHFAWCLRSCDRCRAEALRELDWIEASIRGKPKGPFIPAAVAKGRIDAANEEQRRRNKFNEGSSERLSAFAARLNARRRASAASARTRPLADRALRERAMALFNQLTADMNGGPVAADRIRKALGKSATGRNYLQTHKTKSPLAEPHKLFAVSQGNAKHASRFSRPSVLRWLRAHFQLDLSPEVVRALSTLPPIA